jgi:phytoene dehydrogenase-like protein
MTLNHYDAIIIGGGHNGLVCAAYLARAGRRVLVCERRDVLGGACVTEEVWPGYRVSTAAYLCSLLHPQIIADLELPRYGFEVYRRETGGFAPFPDGSSLLLYPDAQRTRKELAHFCPEDVDAYFRFELDVERAAEVLEPFFLGPSPSLGHVADAFEKAGIPELFSPFFEGSVRRLLESRFRNEKLMAVLATDGLIGTCAGVSDLGTAYVLLHHYMGRALGARGLWGYVRGGMGSISSAAAASAKAHGAEIRTGASIIRVNVREGGVVGVVLEDGEEIAADTVLSNAHPSRLFDMLDGEVAEGLGGELSSYHTEGVSCKINMAVSELPDFMALPGKQMGPQHLGTVHLAPSMDFLEAAWQDSKQGRPSSEPMVEVYIQTATDRSLVPEGKHILSCFTQYFPYTLAAGLDRDQEAERYATRVLQMLGQYAPNVPGSVEAMQVLTPQRLEERFGLTGGHIFHGDITPDQMFGGRLGLSGPETPVSGLYFCGSGAFPGGCVSGVPGWNAARAVLGIP